MQWVWVLSVLVEPFSFLQTADGKINIVELLAHVLAVGVSAGAIYKGTDFIAFLYWLMGRNLSGQDKEMPGHAKALCALVLAFVVPPLIYVVLLVDGGVVKYDYRGLLMVVFTSFTTAWAVYARSKYKGKAGSSIENDEGGQ